MSEGEWNVGKKTCNEALEKWKKQASNIATDARIKRNREVRREKIAKSKQKNPKNKNTPRRKTTNNEKQFLWELTPALQKENERKYNSFMTTVP